MKRKGYLMKAFVYFLSLSFLLLMNGFPGILAEANQTIPLGQMVSRGGVKFEVKKNLWEKVVSPFPVFEGMRIRTEKGEAVLILADRTRVEIGPESIFSFDQRDQLNLLQGKIGFRVQPGVTLGFKVGNLRINKSYPLYSSKSPSMRETDEKTFSGSIQIHAKGSVTVKSFEHSLSITGQDGTLLASLSPGETVTIPSTIVHSPLVQMAQRDVVGAERASAEATGEFLGLSTWTWVGIGVAAVAVTAVAVAVASHDEDHERAICPP